MSLPYDVSELLDLLNRNSHTISKYNRGQLAKIIDSEEPFFIQQDGITKKAIINFDDFRFIMEILIFLKHLNEAEEMNFYESVFNRLESPVVAKFSDMVKDFNISKDDLLKAMDEVEFE
ncbi:MAG: hypothetical protein KAX49_16340 [Halanaerobiales bacterium]|nr:hypothetical protein [Halanaerobiales bacterium]